MSLYTGKKVHTFGWKELPIHDDVTKRVEEPAEQENQPKMVDRTPLFEWRHKTVRRVTVQLGTGGTRTT